MSVTVDLSPLEAVLDAREWRIVEGYEEDIADVLESLVRQGATDDDIRRVLRQYVPDDNLIKRLRLAARHLRRQRQEAGQ